MIVRNEEQMLGACLASVSGVDELVVVDTGSTDNTKAVAFAHGATILDFPWIDDFSAARNFAKAAVKSDWIISIDADEIMQPGGIDAIRAAAVSLQPSMLIRIWNGVGEQARVPRVFRNLPSIQWNGRVHETITKVDFVDVDATIVYGRSPAHDADPERYLRILGRAVFEDPTSARYRYYYARELWYARRFEEAVAQFEECLRYSKWLPERADAYLLKARCLWQIQRGDEAREACAAALVINANFAEAARFMAEMSWENNAVRWRDFADKANNDGILFVRT